MLLSKKKKRPPMGTAIRHLGGWMDGTLINNPDFDPPTVIEIWDNYDSHEMRRLISTIRNDLDLLAKIENLHSQGSPFLKRKPESVPEWASIADSVHNSKDHLDNYLEIHRILLGSLDKRVVGGFPLSRALAQTKHYLESIGLKTGEACIWSAACAVHLGRVPIERSPIRLSPGANFKQLATQKNNRQVTALVDRVRKNIAQHKNRLKKANTWIPCSIPLQGVRAKRNRALLSTLKQIVQSERQRLKVSGKN